MKTNRNILLPAVIATVLIAAAILALRPRGVEVDLGVVDRGPLTVSVLEDGKTRIRDRYTVSAPTAGKLERIRWKPGDTVTKDKDLLAVLEASDPELLDPRARAQAEARVRAAEALESQTAAELERAKVSHNYAVTNLARARKLLEVKGTSRQEFENAEQAELSTGHALKEAEFAGKVATFEREQAAAVLMRADKGSGNAGDSNYEICSPVSGRILRVLQESSTVVTPGMKLLELGDPENLEIEVDVLSTDAVRIKPGARVSIEHWGGERPLVGRVRLIEPAGFTKVSALGVEEQRVNIVVDFVSPLKERSALGDGFRVEARIVAWESTDVRRIPTGALFRDGSEWAVFVAEDNQAKLRRVKTGSSNDEFTEVISGLEEHEKVILYPGDLIEDGSKIRVHR
jgi:HlyD family secretion protein